MSDTRTPRLSRRAKYMIAIVALIIWTALANTWTSRGCDLVPSYGYVVGHWTPAANQGCESEPGGAQYTDHYDG